MTFPRPCLYALLAACLLLPGCVANQYAIKINAITNGDIQAGIGDVYYIMAVKGQEDDLVFLELKRNLESALPQAGLKVTKSLPHATAVLFAGYKSQTVARQTTVSEPVYGVTRVETRGTGEYINTLTGKTSKTSVSTPTYGVTGYKNTQKDVAQNKIVLLLAADSLKTKKKMWETIVTYTGNSFDNRKMLDMMVMGAKDYLAQTTPGDTGSTAGPDRPPVFIFKMGRRVFTSMRIPRMVLMRETASAPAASTARAISVMSVTLGDSFTITGTFPAWDFAISVTSAASSGRVP